MSEILNLLIIFAPLFLIIGLANVAEGQRVRGEPYRGLAITSYALLAFLYLAAIVIGLALQGLSVLSTTQPQLFAELNLDLQLDSLTLLGLGLWLPALVGLLLLLPPVRRLVARLIPLDPANPVHGIALAFSVLVVVNLLFTLGIGLSNLADLLAEQAASQAAAGVTSNTMLSLWVQQIFTALLAMVGVGWLIRRDTPTTLARLGIVVPSFNQLLLGLFVGLGMVPVIMAIERLTSALNIGTDASVAKLTEQLLGPLFTTPLGIITIGAAAALGEETIFRGAMQPRFGLLFTTLLFALVHSNYGLSLSTLIVFMVGLVLGLVRQRTNTTTSMVTHAVYNISLAILATMGV